MSYLFQPDNNTATASKPRAQFHTLSVKDINRETAEAVSVAFNVPAELQQAYAFIPGQYLTLKATIAGEEVRRSYSICSSYADNELRVAIKMVPDGRFSTYANQTLKVGDSIEVMTPEGQFHTELAETNRKRYVAFAAGSGITPVYSIMKTVLEQEPASEFILFYGNKNASSIIFKEKIEDLKNTYMGRLSVYNILSREDQGSDLFYGRLNAEKCKAFSQKLFDVNKVDEYFLCGPEEMIRNVSETLESLGTDKSAIHFELFTTPVENIPSVAGKQQTTEEEATSGSKEVNAQVTVILDGDETHFDLATKGQSILDAAIAAGADVPFSCKGAVCCTCRAKVMEGEASMDMNYALMDDEVEDGFILTCQSHPTSQRLVVSYDE